MRIIKTKSFAAPVFLCVGLVALSRLRQTAISR